MIIIAAISTHVSSIQSAMSLNISVSVLWVSSNPGVSTRVTSTFFSSTNMVAFVVRTRSVTDFSEVPDHLVLDNESMICRVFVKAA